MRVLRLPILTLLFLGFVTVGQAYPLSYVLTHSSHTECGCNQAGRKCVHGCLLKKRRARVLGCHQEKTWAFVNPTCSKQAQPEAVNFQGDPFLPQRSAPLVATTFRSETIPEFFSSCRWSHPPETPPPKRSAA